jgi:hypothetical protein
MQSSIDNRQSSIVFWIFVLSLIISGCAGYGRVHMVPLGTKKIDTTAPLIVEAEPDECYFWIRDDKQLCVAMRQFSASILGKPAEREFLLSLVVDGAPAAESRDYRMDRTTARLRHRGGYAHTRAASVSGIVAVWDYNNDGVRGRFRFLARMQSYSVLTGWSESGTILCTGEFTAVHDAERGEQILTQSEGGAMSR